MDAQRVVCTVKFYEEAWKQMPNYLSNRPPKLIGGLYGMVVIANPARQRPLVVFLVPAWSPPSGEKSFGTRLAEALRGLIAKAKK